MTKQELITEIADKCGITKKQAGNAVFIYADTVKEVLGYESKVTLPHLGTLTVTDRPEREGRNPRTGAKLQIPAGKKITFKAAKELKEAV